MERRLGAAMVRIVGRNILNLVAQGMRRRLDAGAVGRLLGRRNQGFFLLYDPRTFERTLAVHYDFDMRLLWRVAYRRERVVGELIAAGTGVVGFQQSLQPAHVSARLLRWKQRADYGQS